MRIKSYFGDLKTANEVVNKLQGAGFNNSYIDANDHYIGNRDVKTDLAGTAGGESLSDLVLNSGADNVDKGSSPLAAANPMVSGMSDFEEITDINCCVITDVDENNIHEAEEIIKSMGGTLEDPNVSRYKAIAREDVLVERPDGQGNQIYTNRK
ncbi:hypothetical protein [Clostridium sp. Cult3]|uniref:hypothetical protein n=1 Tax=Clostridium sp. Cult3 TaxID=2079004 RepID=UPI001F20E1C8|nr:hypothetical protein [Clostridium sp. Cult3]MCF6460769.1 hypothetical protein [Clostridium sp. Cult3]